MATANKHLKEKDIRDLEDSGISVEECSRQIDLLKCSPPRVTLERPCTINDGITSIAEEDVDKYIAIFHESAKLGRWSRFVPASGAATRLFSLDENSKKRLFENLHFFAFYDILDEHLARSGYNLDECLRENRSNIVFEAMLREDELGLGDNPKGLLPFHRYSSSNRCPMEDHLLEQAECLHEDDIPVRAHFTVSGNHQSDFEVVLELFRAQWPDLQWDVSFSTQSDATNTIALDEDGQCIRNSDGSLLLRPGGHGSLISNLGNINRDLIFIKNIDNICHARSRGISTRWIQVISGYLCHMQRNVFNHLQALESKEFKDAIAPARDFLQETFPGASFNATSDMESMRCELIDRLHRPLRVCGMVAMDEETGGGPFWIRTADGSLSAQIVETPEIGSGLDDQRAIMSRATHFNPAFIAAATRDHNGIQYDLKKYIDHERVIITEKIIFDKKATVLEHPGLWNGSMALWNTVFVEVPAAVFTPVKNILDLLQPQHLGIEPGMYPPG